MSGHSKWATIKRKKAAVDSQRAVAFQKFSREIIVAARLGGPDLAANFRLRTAVEKAKAAGLPKDNIKRAIDKGAGSSGGENYQELIYEGYADGGVAVVVETMTDNKNRTAGDIRSYFTKFSGNLGETGCVGWMFKQVGQITFEKSDNWDAIVESAINLGAEDFVEDEEDNKIITSVADFQTVVEGLEKEGYTHISAEFTRIPENEIEITDPTVAKHIMLLIEKLEEHDDVQNVYANFDISDELMEQLDI